MTRDELIKDYSEKLNDWRRRTQMTDAEIITDEEGIEESKDGTTNNK